MRGFLEGDLVRTDVEIAMQRSLRDLKRVCDEPVEFDLVDVRSAFSAHEVQVFAVALASIAKAQRGTALKHDMSKHAGVRQRRQQMKMNDFLDEVLLHLARDAVLDHEVGDCALNTGGLAVHYTLSSQIASARVSLSMRPVFLPTRRRSRAARSTVASSTPSSLARTSVP